MYRGHIDNFFIKHYFLWIIHFVKQSLYLRVSRSSEFTKFESFWWIKCSGYLNFLWNYFRTHFIAVRWCTSKWTLGHRRKKSGGYNTSSPISLSNTFHTTPDKRVTFFRQYSSYIPCQMNWKRIVSRQIVVIVLLNCIYKDCV